MPAPPANGGSPWALDRSRARSAPGARRSHDASHETCRVGEAALLADARRVAAGGGATGVGAPQHNGEPGSDAIDVERAVHESGVMSHRFVLLTIVSAWLVWSLASPAEAQRASATILRTHGSEGCPGGDRARGFDRVLRQRLDALDVVDIAGSVELDLEAVQLALGCMGESVECLRSAATQAEAEVLVYASIERAGTTVVSVMRFDATSGTLRRAVRTVDSDAAVLASADPIVRELWDVAVIDTPAAARGAHRREPRASRRGRWCSQGPEAQR
jgi:hypothetical protein